MNHPEAHPPKRAVRIAIATSGRFHVLDLARELAELGHDVCFYSMLPDSRAEAFGLDSRRHRSLLPYVAPFAGLQRYAPRFIPELRDRLMSNMLDRAVESVLEPCDVFIAMSGIFVRALRFARQKYGAKIWVERGSRHILSQAEILAAAPGARGPAENVIARELEAYRLADRIVVPSRHVVDSFARDPAAYAKLFVNPYGTKLDMFPYRARERAIGPLRLLFVGAWSRRKGCDVLEKAVRGSEGISLRHVGNIGDLPFPGLSSEFEHFDPVPQPQLNSFYHGSAACVLASREDGFGMVLGQALATGLPIICTDRTGGEDLRHTAALQDRITIVPHDDVDALRRAIEALRQRLSAGPQFAPLSDDDLATLAWPAYAVRYEKELLTYVP
jgi:glycosyltransferase involved in cell wall biosynthesis